MTFSLYTRLDGLINKIVRDKENPGIYMRKTSDNIMRCEHQSYPMHQIGSPVIAISECVLGEDKRNWSER